MKKIIRRIALAALLAIPAVAFAGDVAGSKKESCCPGNCCPNCPSCPR